jgi:hypothetical protein
MIKYKTKKIGASSSDCIIFFDFVYKIIQKFTKKTLKMLIWFGFLLISSKNRYEIAILTN